MLKAFKCEEHQTACHEQICLMSKISNQTFLTYKRIVQVVDAVICLHIAMLNSDSPIMLEQSDTGQHSAHICKFTIS